MYKGEKIHKDFMDVVTACVTDSKEWVKQSEPIIESCMVGEMMGENQ